ncbi:MAG: LysM peptidoglycan-binding domain-containing protein [Leptospira sp.]|nr:LysM peptidoglycan-binding domain-containing protein [Leptospira sp.]
MIYTIRDDDTLQRIAAKYWNKWELYPIIRDNNPHIADWDNLIPGQRLFIADVLTESTIHIVEFGDTFESISQQYYRTEHFSGMLSEENGNAQPYENIGSEYFIPALVSKQEVLAAERRLK